MKIGIIGDVHYGASFNLGYKDHRTGRNSRLLDYEKTAFFTIDSMVEQGCKVVIFTGDVFEHRHPNALYQKMFSQLIYYAISQGIEEIHIVVGNHDQQRQSESTTISYLSELNLPNVIVHNEIGLREIKYGGRVVCNFISLPYRDMQWLEKETYGEAIEEISNTIKYTLASIGNEAPKLLVGHMAVEGTFFGDDSAEQLSESELFLPIEMFRWVDHTILGHVHTPYVISEQPFVAYVGSMEKRSASEDHKKKYAILDTEKNKVDFYDTPCREIYDINIDLSEQLYGANLQSEVLARIDEFATSAKLKNSIVRVIMQISSADNVYLDIDAIYSHLKNSYQIHFCTPIKPSLFYTRQARDSNINESISDSEAFTRYIKNTIDDKDLIDSILSVGLSIISENAE